MRRVERPRWFSCRLSCHQRLGRWQKKQTEDDALGRQVIPSVLSQKRVFPGRGASLCVQQIVLLMHQTISGQSFLSQRSGHGGTVRCFLAGFWFPWGTVVHNEGLPERPGPAGLLMKCPSVGLGPVCVLGDVTVCRDTTRLTSVTEHNRWLTSGRGPERHFSAEGYEV